MGMVELGGDAVECIPTRQSDWPESLLREPETLEPHSNCAKYGGQRMRGARGKVDFTDGMHSGRVGDGVGGLIS